MNIVKILLVGLILLSATVVCLGQEYFYAEDENWIKDFGGDYSRGDFIINYRLDNFKKADIPKAKQKLAEIKKMPPKNEWEGIYYQDWGIGDRMMIWNAESGFFKFYHYHEFRRLDYGKIINTEGFIKFDSEKPSNSKKDSNKSYEKQIKIKFGERHFLVPESRIKDFLKMTAGLEGNSVDISYYWTKRDDMRKDGFGVPIIPAKYNHLLSYPIEAKIIRIQENKVIPNKDSTETVNYDDILYQLILNVGKDKNVSVGMDFYVKELNEWIRITKVNQKSSIGVIKRGFYSDEKGKEECWDGRGGSNQLTPCKEIKIGMKVKTKTDL